MKKNIFLFLFICLLAGCAEIPKPQNIPWIDHQQKLELLNDWEFSGKIALITPKERHSLNIYWSQNHNQTHLILSTFLGITVLELEQIKGATKITNNDGKIFWGNNSEQLIYELSGLIIPVDSLKQWIKGNPENAAYTLNSNNLIATLDSKNNQWHVKYTAYDAYSNIMLPTKLELKDTDKRIKFSISRWKLAKNSNQ